MSKIKQQKISGSINALRQGVSIRSWRSRWAHANSYVLFSDDGIKHLIRSGSSEPEPHIFDETISGRGAERLDGFPAHSRVSHDVMVLNYGQSLEFDDTLPFDDIDGPTAGSAPRYLSSLPEYPIVFFNKSLKGPQTDGVIEPLTIRRMIDFSVLGGNNERDIAHSIKAGLGYMVAESFRGFNTISQFIEFSPNRIPAYVDNVESFYTDKVPLPGYVTDEVASIKPYVDTSLQEYQARNVTDDQIRAILESTDEFRSGSYGGTDNMLPRNSRSATAGFVYTLSNLTGSTKYGTDSIAYGGLKK